MINSVATVYKDQAVLRSASTTEHEVISLNNAHTVGIIAQYTFSPGTYTKQGGDAKSGFYLPSKYGMRGVVTENAIADPFQVIQAYYSPQKLCGVSIFNGKMCTKAVFEITKQLNTEEKVIIYSGIVGSRVIFDYREISNDQTKPDLKHKFEYDLSESSEIVLDGARLQVMDATSELIKYRVLSNFD